MVVEQTQPTEMDVGSAGQNVEVAPTNARHEGLHFIPLTSTSELARLSAPRQDADYTDTALIAVEGVQMPVCAVRTLLDSESIHNLQTLSSQLRDSLGYDPNLQIVIAGPQLQYQGSERPIMYPAHVMTSFEMEPEVAEGQKTRVTVLGPVCVSIAHQIMLDGRYPFPARVRATEALLEDLRSAANGRYTYIAMPERNGPQRASTTVSLLDGTNLTINSSPTHALMTHLAGHAEPLTVQVDRGEKGNKPYTLYPLPPRYATSLGQDDLGEAETQQRIQEVSAAIMQAWEGNFDKHEKGSDEGAEGVILQEVARIMKWLEGFEIYAFLNAIDENDALDFQLTSNELLQRIQDGEWSQEVSLTLAGILQGVFAELSLLNSISEWDAEERDSLPALPAAILDITRTHFRGYEPAVREEEDLGMHIFHFDPSRGLTHGSMAEAQRRFSINQHHLVWNFIRNHPELPICGQVLLDQVHADEASDQSTHPLYVAYREAKAEFYRLFVNMNKDVPTTNSSVDIARTASIIRAMQATGKQFRTVAVAGSGNMLRFEGPLFTLLRQEGIAFEQIVAVDRVDYANEIREHLPELNVDFHQGDILDAKAFGGKKVNMLLYPWSVFSDILPVRDSIQALHTAASLLEPGGIMIVDQAVPIGNSSYKKMQKEQAVHTGVPGVFERSFAGVDGQELWSAFNIMELESFLRDAAQAGFVPRNIGATVQEQHALVEKIESDESILVREAETQENLDAMAHPIYQANGWNRMTLVLEYVGQEEALRTAKAGKSLFHLLSCTAMGETEDGS